jgi:hypothetical protein
MVRNAVSAPDYFLIPSQRVVELGTRVGYMTIGRFFGKTGRGLAVTTAILAAIGLTTVPRPQMQVGVGAGMGVGVGSALVPLSPSGWEPSSSVPYFHIPITTLITIHLLQLTIHPPLAIIHRRRIRTSIHKRGRIYILLIHRHRRIHIVPIHRWRIIPPHGAVGAPITIIITLVEQRDTLALARPPSPPMAGSVSTGW